MPVQAASNCHESSDVAFALLMVWSLCMQVNVANVNKELQSLKPANRGAPDPVSKLWPNHYSATVQRKHEAGCTPLSEAEQGVSTAGASKQSGNENLKRRFPEYYSQYGYD